MAKGKYMGNGDGSFGNGVANGASVKHSGLDVISASIHYSQKITSWRSVFEYFGLKYKLVDGVFLTDCPICEGKLCLSLDTTRVRKHYPFWHCNNVCQRTAESDSWLFALSKILNVPPIKLLARIISNNVGTKDQEKHEKEMVQSLSKTLAAETEEGKKERRARNEKLGVYAIRGK